MKRVSRDQARMFLHSVRADRFEALVTVAIATGLRQGELLALRREDVDLDAAQMRVRHMLQKLNGE